MVSAVSQPSLTLRRASVALPVAMTTCAIPSAWKLERTVRSASRASIQELSQVVTSSSSRAGSAAAPTDE